MWVTAAQPCINTPAMLPTTTMYSKLWETLCKKYPLNFLLLVV